MFYIWTTPANLKIQLKPSMSEIRNYLVANPIFRNIVNRTLCLLYFDSFLKFFSFFSKYYRSSVNIHRFFVSIQIYRLCIDIFRAWSVRFAKLFAIMAHVIRFYRAWSIASKISRRER